MTIKLLILHLLSIFFTFLTSSHSSPPFNFTLFGTSVVDHNSITLTKHLNNCNSNPPNSDVGRIFYKHPIQYLDSSIKSPVSFSTRFTFTIIPPPPPCLSGEGIAFVITTDPNSLRHSLGTIGLPKTLHHNSRDSSYLAVEFDTNFDEDLGDISDNHVGIRLDSYFSVASIDLMDNGVYLKSGKQITVTIEYREKAILIWVGYDHKLETKNLILTVPIHLSNIFSRSMYVGFSGANGKGSSTHMINSWYFQTFSDVVDSNVGPENCLICFPEEEGGKLGLL